MTTILSQIYSPIQRIGLALQRNFIDPQLFQELKNTYLLHSSTSFEFFKLFNTDDFVSKMAEQTNFYAVQRGAPGSFNPV